MIVLFNADVCEHPCVHVGGRWPLVYRVALGHWMARGSLVVGGDWLLGRLGSGTTFFPELCCLKRRGSFLCYT